MRHPKNEALCAVCGRRFGIRATFPVAALRPSILSEIRRDHPAISEDDRICHDDLARYRVAHVENLLIAERGELSELDAEVVASLRSQDLSSLDAQELIAGTLTFGQRLADRIASFGGSWTFLIIFAAIVFAWMAINVVLLTGRAFDPYPFILLNLLLSCLAAIQAPVIMMSQNRQEAKDRIRAEYDYRINLRAELEIRHLHEKVDHLLIQQWERLVEIQEVQIELLEELRHSRRESR